MAEGSSEVGGISSFVTVAGQPINVARSGSIVAAFTYDDIAWTEVQSRFFIAATAEIRELKPGAVPVLASVHRVTRMATAELGKLGWKIVQLKPLQ